MHRPPGLAHNRLATLAIAALLCMGGVAAPGPGWAAGATTLIWGKAGEADTLDNPLSVSGETSLVTTQIFNTLVRMKPGSTDVEPDLATRWSVSPDGKTWTFTLRRGVTFQDGTPWNAAAKFNIDRWADAANPYHAVASGDYTYWNTFMAASFQEARAADPYTLQIVLKQPNAPLLANVSVIGFAFASPAALRQYGGAGIGQHPVGTGAYKLVEWVQDDHTTLQANPTYFRAALPRTQRLIMRVIKDNSARFLALKSGEINGMELPNPDDIALARADRDLAVVYRPAFNVGVVRFNFNAPPFKDKRVRQAMALAINRKAIVDSLYGGNGIVADQTMPPGMWGRAAVAGYPYDPVTSKRLLAEAGYPSGFSFEFWYLPTSRAYFPNPKDIATAIANDLAQVGIRAQLMTEDLPTYTRDRQTNRFQVWMIGESGDNGDPDDWLGFQFPRHAPDNATLSYDNQTVFDLINTAKITTPQAARAAMYAQAEMILLNDYRDIPIAHAKGVLLVRKNVEGVVGQPDGNEYLELVSVR